MRTMGPNEALAELEHLIELFRHARSRPDTPQYRSLLALRVASKHLSAAQPLTINGTRDRLDELVERAINDKARLGHVPGARLMQIGQETLGRWPTIRRGLTAAPANDLAITGGHNG